MLEDAARELEIASRIMPENPNIQVQLATVLVALLERGDESHRAAAIDRVKRTLILRPDLVDAIVLRAKLRVWVGNWNGAVEDWTWLASDAPESARKLMSQFRSGKATVLARNMLFNKPYQGAKTDKTSSWLGPVTPKSFVEKRVKKDAKLLIQCKGNPVFQECLSGTNVDIRDLVTAAEYVVWEEEIWMQKLVLVNDNFAKYQQSQEAKQKQSAARKK